MAELNKPISDEIESPTAEVAREVPNVSSNERETVRVDYDPNGVPKLTAEAMAEIDSLLDVTPLDEQAEALDIVLSRLGIDGTSGAAIVDFVGVDGKVSTRLINTTASDFGTTVRGAELSPVEPKDSEISVVGVDVGYVQPTEAIAADNAETADELVEPEKVDESEEVNEGNEELKSSVEQSLQSIRQALDEDNRVSGALSRIREDAEAIGIKLLRSEANRWDLEALDADCRLVIQRVRISQEELSNDFAQLRRVTEDNSEAVKAILPEGAVEDLTNMWRRHDDVTEDSLKTQADIVRVLDEAQSSRHGYEEFGHRLRLSAEDIDVVISVRSQLARRIAELAELASQNIKQPQK
ncbi:MAG: hypothetical protein ABI397_00315 [Candidatus Saccharimonas sp.]